MGMDFRGESIVFGGQDRWEEKKEEVVGNERECSIKWIDPTTHYLLHCERLKTERYWLQNSLLPPIAAPAKQKKTPKAAQERTDLRWHPVPLPWSYKAHIKVWSSLTKTLNLKLSLAWVVSHFSFLLSIPFSYWLTFFTLPFKVEPLCPFIV